MKIARFLAGLLVVLFVAGCASPTKKIKSVELGMTPGEVLERMGEPNTIRAAQFQSEGSVTEVWEYFPPTFTFNPRTYLIIFQDGKLVQWGIETDLAGSGLFKK